MSVASNSRELSRLRGFPIYSFEYGVNHQVGPRLYSIDVYVHFLVSTQSTLHGAPPRTMNPIVRFFRGIPENIFQGVFEMYQCVTFVHDREEMTRGFYSELDSEGMLQELFSECDLMTHIYSRTPFHRVASIYAEFEPDYLGDSFELFVTLA